MRDTPGWLYFFFIHACSLLIFLPSSSFPRLRRSVCILPSCALVCARTRAGSWAAFGVGRRVCVCPGRSLPCGPLPPTPRPRKERPVSVRWHGCPAVVAAAAACVPFWVTAVVQLMARADCASFARVARRVHKRSRFGGGGGVGSPSGGESARPVLFGPVNVARSKEGGGLFFRGGIF